MTRQAGGDPPFDMRAEAHGDAVVLTLSGACTMSDAAALGDELVKLAASSAKVVVLDLSALEFIESTNLGKIVAGYLKLRKRGGDLRIVKPQPEIRNLLELTRLSSLFGVFHSIADAVNAPSN